MRRLSKASPAVSTSGAGTRRSLFGLACLCVVGLVVLLGTSAPSAGAAGEICPNAEFRVGPSANLPECRAYEQVSPVDKNGNSVLVPAATITRALAGWSSPQGDTILYNPASGPSLQDPARGFNFAQVAERTAGGWVNRAAANGPSANAVVDGVSSVMIQQIPSADRKSLLFVSGAPFTLDNPNLGTIDSGGVNIARGNSVEWISKPTWAGAYPQPGNLEPGSFAPVGASEDLSTAFFIARGTLTPEDGVSGRLGTSGNNDPGLNQALYRWHNGQLSNAGVLPDGTTDPMGSQMAGDARARASNLTGTSSNMADLYGASHSVTGDGSSWLFVSPDPGAESGRPTQLYLARDGQPSVLLSTEAGQSVPVSGSAGVFRVGARNGSPSGATNPTLAGIYAMRSKDGRFVVFTTTDALTESSPAGPSEKTYRYDTDTGTLAYLPEMTFDPAPVVPGNTVGSVLNMSDDGSRILYRNPETGVLGLWRDNGPPVVVSATSTSNDIGKAFVGLFDSRFSRDGRSLVLTSSVPLRGETDHQIEGEAGQGVVNVQIYRYAEANDELDCISCPPQNITPRGPSTISPLGAPGGSGDGTLYPVEATRGFSADGSRIFFQTTSPLVAADHNAVSDVYEWGAGAGLQLLSGGRSGAFNSFLVDSDESGDNVFFVTRDGLVAQDTDGAYDMYDARVGGGFAPPPLPEPGCSGDACQGPAGSPPPLGAPQSTTVRPGVVTGRQSAKLALRRTNASAGGVKLRVAVKGAGKLRANGPGLRPASRAVKRSATYTLKLGLRGGARRTLQRKGHLTVRLRVRFRPSEGKATTKTVKLTIKRNAHSNRKGH